MPAGSSSLVNKVEAEMLLCVFQQFMRKLPELTQRPATAIITPYKAQASTRVICWHLCPSRLHRSSRSIMQNVTSTSSQTFVVETRHMFAVILVCMTLLQVKLLRQRFEQALGADYHKFVDIDTIDGFQVNKKLPTASPSQTQRMEPSAHCTLSCQQSLVVGAVKEYAACRVARRTSRSSQRCALASAAPSALSRTSGASMSA